MRQLLTFTLKAKVHTLDSKWDLKAESQIFKEKENKVEDNRKEEGLEECGEVRE